MERRGAVDLPLTVKLLSGSSRRYLPTKSTSTILRSSVNTRFCIEPAAMATAFRLRAAAATEALLRPRRPIP